MNYQKLYNLIINHRRNNPVVDGYTETHHIQPRCLGGSNESTNLIKLTAREHFICHFLLVKIHITKPTRFKMINAFAAMLQQSKNQQRYVNSRLYEKMKTEFSLTQSINQSGGKNSQHGTRWVYNLEEEKSIKISKTQPIPFGWKEGRVLDFALFKTTLEEKTARKHTRKIEQETKYNHYHNWHILYRNVGFEEFVKQTNYKGSQSALIRCFKTHLPEFTPYEKRNNKPKDK